MIGRVVKQLERDEERAANVRRARARVDQARATHDRLWRELEALHVNPRKHQTAIEAFRLELERARVELRAASRELIRSI